MLSSLINGSYDVAIVMCVSLGTLYLLWEYNKYNAIIYKLIESTTDTAKITTTTDN